MKTTIYDPTPAPPPPPPVDELCLRLIVGYGNRVQLIAVDPRTGEKLDGGVLMTFGKDGTFTRANSIRALGAGVQVDDIGRMVEAGDYS